MSRIFIKEFFKNRKQIGSIAPSSALLARKMLKAINFGTVQVIIEYGPGTGIFTRRIIKNMSPETKLYIFELDEVFFNKLKHEFKDFPNVFVLNDSALQVKSCLQEHNEELADVVISSLPLSNFKLRLAKSIIDNAKDVLKDNGQFIQYQYSLSARKMLERIFEKVAIQYVVGNIPPAFVYNCQKK